MSDRNNSSKQPGQIEWLRDIVRRLEASTYQDRVVLQLPQAKALLAEIDARPCPKHESGRHWCGNCFEWVGAVETEGEREEMLREIRAAHHLNPPNTTPCQCRWCASEKST